MSSLAKQEIGQSKCAIGHPFHKCAIGDTPSQMCDRRRPLHKCAISDAPFTNVRRGRRLSHMCEGGDRRRPLHKCAIGDTYTSLFCTVVKTRAHTDVWCTAPASTLVCL
eukprot:350044-Chlamydomonas_euryale.AAC.7